jgi:hypothetical protein
LGSAVITASVSLPAKSKDIFNHNKEWGGSLIRPILLVKTRGANSFLGFFLKFCQCNILKYQHGEIVKNSIY